jgi:hypothetical protein
VDVEHCNLLSWFSEGESHEQDGERLLTRSERTAHRFLGVNSTWRSCHGLRTFGSFARAYLPGIKLGGRHGGREFHMRTDKVRASASVYTWRMFLSANRYPLRRNMR